MSRVSVSCSKQYQWMAKGINVQMIRARKLESGARKFGSFGSMKKLKMLKDASKGPEEVCCVCSLF